MRKTFTPSLSRYSKNLKALMAMSGLKPDAVADAGDVSRKTVYNILGESHDTRIKGLDGVASVFGLATWQMLAADIDGNPAEHKQIMRLLDLFSRADEAGRQAIMQVAEIAAAKASK